MRLAAIDIGSNSVHMVIADALGPGAFRVVDRERERVKLGAGAFRTGRLGAESMKAALHALMRFAKLCRRLRVDQIVAAATSAVRESENGQAFLTAVKRLTGIDARVISGLEEARFIFRGVQHAMDLNGRRGLILDLGGGSLEVMYGNARRLLLARSLPLGVQRLRDRFGAHDPLPRKVREQLVKHVRQVVGPAIAQVRKRGVDRVICTSGTHMTLGLACLRTRGRDPWGSLNGYVVQTSELRDLAGELLDQDAAERMRQPGIDERRADTIHFGAAVLMTLLEMLKAREFQLCSASLREGLLLAEIEKSAKPGGVGDARLASALELLHRVGGDARRGRHVADLALNIFDCTRRAHGLVRRDRELLEVAALLEDLGRGVHFHDREHLSYQLIRGGGLRGVTDEEVEVIGLTARYSRAGTPKARHHHFADLGAEARHRVRVLAGILRIADNLDRGRAAVVRSVKCRASRGVLRMNVQARGDAALELFAAQRATKLLAQTLEVDIVVTRAAAGKAAAATKAAPKRPQRSLRRPRPKTPRR